jgi:hypothetical protein
MGRIETRDRRASWAADLRSRSAPGWHVEQLRFRRAFVAPIHPLQGYTFPAAKPHTVSDRPHGR